MSKKITYGYIKKYIEKEGYELLSKEYINARTKLKIKCNKGHEYNPSWNTFQQGHRCLICSGKQKLTYEFIKREFEKENYKLLSDEYINNESKLDIICDKGHKTTITWVSFQQGSRCKICGFGRISSIKSLDYEFVKEQFKKEGYKLLSNEYKNAHTDLEVECNNGHKYYVTYANFKYSRNGQDPQRCPFCNKNMISKREKQILNYIKSLNLNTKILENYRKIIVNPLTGRNLELDIWFPELNKAIEFNGRYYHKRKNVKIRDKIKKEQCKEKEIDLLIIEEQDWINDKEQCLEIINKFIKKEKCDENRKRNCRIK